MIGVNQTIAHILKIYDNKQFDQMKSDELIYMR